MASLFRGDVFRTTSFQLTLLYTGLSAFALSTLLGVVYWSSVGYMERQTDETIISEISSLREHYRRTGLNGLARVIGDRIRTEKAPRDIYLFTNQSFTPIAGNIRQFPDIERQTEDGWLEFTHRGSLVRARLYNLENGLRLLVGRDVQELQQFAGLFRRALLIGGTITFALLLGGGYWMSSRVMRQVNDINQATRRIMEGDLSQRMPTRGTGDELDQLAEQLNGMLARISVLMQSSRLVADNVAHDLRTPLTRLRNRMEALRESDSDNMRLGLESCIEDADALLQTFQAMLRIARLRSGAYEGTLVPVDLSALAADAVELYQALADDANLELITHIEPGCAVAGDRDLLFQAISNLFDNAIKYSQVSSTGSGAPRPNQTVGQIKIHVARGRGDATTPGQMPRIALSVSDSGPGVPAHLRDRVIEPFFRLDQSRSKPGNGLGLPLVKAIADYHHAEMHLRDANPGLQVELILNAIPSTKTSPPDPVATTAVDPWERFRPPGKTQGHSQRTAHAQSQNAVENNAPSAQPAKAPMITSQTETHQS